MSIEEFRFLFPSVAAFAVPPSRALAVEDGAGGSGDCDGGAGDGDEGSGPFGVAECGCALEYYLEDRC